nr:Protein F23H11.2 [Haemonchus contortus]
MTSNSCSICGSTETRVLDGLMYCASCGTQIFDFREVEEDEEGLVIGSARVKTKKSREVSDQPKATSSGSLLLTSSSRKRRKGEKLESYRPVAGTSSASSELRKDYTSGRYHAPAYLRTIGTRISTFTKMLAKGAAMISEEKAVPSGFCNHVLAIYQHYLAAWNVAFTGKDYTEDVELMFRAVLLNTNLALKRAREKKENKMRREKRGKEALEKSTTAWDILMSDTLNEDLEVRSDEEELNDSVAEPTSSSTQSQTQLVNIVDTNIPKEILKNAASIYLTMDVLIALLYISVVTFGCRWIMLSDILRWMREGRLGISIYQFTALSTRNFDDVKAGPLGWSTKLNLPLFEFQRTVFFVWQICRLPPVPAKIDFPQIVSRLLYHLSLPEALMEHILLLMELAPPCVELDGDSLRRQGRIEQGSFFRWLSTSRNGFSYSDMMTVFGRPKQHQNRTLNTDIFFSNETKAAAFILMALKLYFCLDDVREFQCSVVENATCRSFNFMRWYYQLVMRLMFWEGYDPLDVLQTNKPVEPLLYERNFSLGQVNPDSDVIPDEGVSTYQINSSTRDAGFAHSVPSSIKIDSSTSIPNPFPEDTYQIRHNVNDDESLYVPLRHQTNVLREFLLRPRSTTEKEEIRTVIDETAVRIFKTEFTKCTLEKESVPIRSDSTSTAGNAHFSTGSRQSRWHSHFPCAKGYVRYPRPQFTNGGVIYLKEDDFRSLIFNRRMGLQKTCHGLRMLFASRKSAVDAFEVAKTAMSHTFAKLLHCFSKIIGESEPILYCAFMMLEFQIADRQRFNNLKRSMVDGKVCPLQSTAVNSEGKRSFKTLYISPAEDVSDAGEIEVVRLGVPRLWGTSQIERFADDVASEEFDYSSESSDDDDFSPSDSSTKEDDEESVQDVSRNSPRETVVERTLPIFAQEHLSLCSASTSREVQNRQRYIRAYEFDLIWMLITMRYW